MSDWFSVSFGNMKTAVIAGKDYVGVCGRRGFLDRLEQPPDRFIEGFDGGCVQRVPSRRVSRNTVFPLLEHDVRGVVWYVAEVRFVRFAVGFDEFDRFVSDQEFVFAAGSKWIAMSRWFDSDVKALHARG